jgi:hypothetical protein
MRRVVECASTLAKIGALSTRLRNGLMEITKILGVDIHDAVMDLKQAIGDQKLIIRSPMTIRALERVRLGPDGRVDPTTVDPEVRATARAYIAGQQTRKLEAQMAKTKADRIRDLLDG